jgi:sugar lactone lactonase YvrE
MSDDLFTSGAITVAADCANLLGESPVWLAGERALYWVDIHAPAIWRLRLGDHQIDHWAPPFAISSLVPRAAGGLAGAGERGIIRLDPNANDYAVIAHPGQGETGNRYNDGAVDPAGGYWVGSMDKDEARPSGKVYRVSADHGWQALDSDFIIPNGPAFSPDGQKAYLADSAKRAVYRYVLEPDGRIIRRDDFLKFSLAQGSPDGMATDANGCLWIAFWDGGCVRCFNPDGSELRQFGLPVSRPTSCAFGGDALDQLFITSARTGLSAAQLAREPLAGNLFVTQPGVHGWTQPSFLG